MVLKERITDNLVRRLASDTFRVNDSQISGFHFRVGQLKNDGARLLSYYFFYRLGGRNGRQVNFFIGNSTTLSAGDARRIALKIEPLVRAGKDLQKMKFDAKNKDLKLKFFWRYSGKEIFGQKYKNARDAIRNIEVLVLPAIGSVALDKISHQLVELRLVKPLISEGKTGSLRVIISQLKALLNIAVSQGLLSVQPIKTFDSVAKVSGVKGQTAIEITGAQLKGIYYRASKEPRKSVYLYCLRLQILTGQPLSVICRSYRQDIKGNLWLLRASDGKLSGRVIPLAGPLKVLFKEILKLFPKLHSLYLLPGQQRRTKDGGTKEDCGMDARALAKAQKRFINSVHEINVSQRILLANIEQAMLALKVNPLAVAYLFDKKLAPSLTLDPANPEIANALARWYRG